MSRLFIDTETFNEADIDVGTYRYAETAEILLFAYAIDDGPVRVWDLAFGEPMPEDLSYALANADEVYAHSAQFDRTVLRLQRPDLCPPLPRWRCTMAQALSHALPGALSDLCSVLDVPEDQRKLAEGRKLILLFTKPLPRNRKLRRATHHTHPAEWERFKAYAANDIEAMRESHRRMPKWNWNESAIAEWHCDQRMNDRGFTVDLELTQAGVHAAEIEKVRLAKRFVELTGGVVERPSQRAQFMALLNERYGLALDNTRSDTFLQLLKGTLNPDCAELMRLSIASNKTSTAKYAALQPAVSSDGIFRGGLQFAGASRTRRWAGRVFQPHNLPARGLPKAPEVATYIESLKAGVHDLMFTELMRFGAAALRGCVVAPPGKVLDVADLSNIEGRMLAWVADEKWKLEAFREYDAGTGPDLYNITAASIIGGDPWKISKLDRNVFGKVPDLSFGYRGGVAGSQTFARAYNVRMADHWGTIQMLIAPELIEKADSNFDKWGAEQIEVLEIDKTEWLASETCKLAWRARHPAIVRFWYALQDACMLAIRNWGHEFRAGRLLKVRCVTFKGTRWMVIALPSGRYLTYFNPRINREGTIVYEGEAAEQGKTNRLWIDVYTHGGKLAGNVCQTLARDVLAEAIPRAETAEFMPVLTVHDEIVTECDADRDSGLVAILAKNPVWATGLPLAAAGFRTTRYYKED
jgi:DNA polymerase